MPDESGIQALVGSIDPLSLTNLTTGAIIGAVGAVVAAIILGAFEALRRGRRRREQIAFVRGLIVVQFTKIRDQEQPSPLPDGSSGPTIDQLYWVYYQGLLRDLEVALSYRMTMLDYGKTHDLRSAIARQISFNQALVDPPTRLLPTQIYRDHYGDFQEIEWLGLPPDLLPPSWSGPSQSP